MPESPHAIAYALLEKIAQSEKWGDPRVPSQWNKSRKEILDAYKECINAVLDVRRYGPWGTGA